MDVIYAQNTDTVAVIIRRPSVEESRRSYRVDLGRGIKAWVSADGETLYSVEVDGNASERAELDELRLITCDREDRTEQVVKLPDMQKPPH